MSSLAEATPQTHGAGVYNARTGIGGCSKHLRCLLASTVQVYCYSFAGNVRDLRNLESGRFCVVRSVIPGFVPRLATALIATRGLVYYTCSNTPSCRMWDD